MKRYGLLILVVGLLLTCMAVAETGLDDETRVAYEVSEEELVRIAQQDFPDWMVADSTRFWSGSYEDRLACWENINLFRIGEGRLEQMELAILVNPLKSGDTVPWEITEIAPIPVNEEAAEAILEAYRTGELFTIYDTQIPENALTGCAVSFLEEGEHWRQLYAYPDFLAGVAMNDENQSVIRIAHWDGKKYDRLIRSKYQEEWLSIWEDSSYNDKLTIDGDLFVCQPDGRWILQEIEGEPSIITIGDRYITDAGWWGYFDSNDVCHYGVPTFETDLERIDFSTIPYFMPDAVRQLDSDGYACVRKDGTPMLESPGGDTLAFCYARTAGHIIENQNGFVRIQIGSEEHGLSGWFSENDLAFGADTEEVACGFPSHAEEDTEGEYLRKVLTGMDTGVLEDWMYKVWLIGKTPSGGWLVQLEDDFVCTAPEDAFTDIGPPRKLREEFEEYYRRYMEQEDTGFCLFFTWQRCAAVRFSVVRNMR